MEDINILNAYQCKVNANANAIFWDPKPRKNKPIEYTILIIRTANSEIANNIDDRIDMIANGGFCMGKKCSATYIIKTDMSSDDIRDRLIKGYYSEDVEIIVLKVNCSEISAILAEPLRTYVKNTFNIE